MTFKKWPRIENHYRDEFISRFLSEFPELEEEIYIVLEKLHGCNVQVFFQPHLPYLIGKRTAFLKDNEKFQGLQSVLRAFSLEFASIQAWVDVEGQTVRLFGEFFGGNLQKGVDYGPDKRVRFFGLMIDDELCPFSRLTRFSQEHGLLRDLVPIVDMLVGLTQALGADSEFDSLINPIKGNICEGVVIMPHSKVYVNAGGKTFLLKKKNPAFLEKAKAPKPPSPGAPEVARLNLLFRSYIAPNRMESVFSKHGVITERSQLGEYIRLVLEDAKEDFMAENEEAMSSLTKAEQRKVFNVGGLIANMLKKTL